MPFSPDGDDSDYTKGPMDEYGNLTDLGAFVDEIEYITSNTIWAQKQYIYNSFLVPSGVTLTINNDIIFYDGTKIILEGGTLLVDGGHLYNANIEVSNSPSSNIMIINDGSIEKASGKSFEIPSGAIFEIDYGTIK